MRNGQDKRRLLLGLALSLLVHGLLVGILPRRKPPAPPPPVTAIELELVQEPPVVATPAPPAKEDPIAEAPVAEARRPPPAPRGDLPPSPPPETTEPRPEGPVERREEDGVWREEALPKLDLVYRPKLEPGAVPEGAPEEAPGEVSEGREIEDRLQAYFRDKRAEEYARSRVEPVIVELRQRLEQKFTVPMEVLEEAPSSPSLGLGAGMRAYATQAERYGATGNPYGEGLLAPGSPEGPDTLASTVFRFRHADAELAPPVSSTSATVTTLVVRIEVVRGEEGIEARILESSGVPRFDQLALEQVRRELLRLTLPPEVRRMRWAFASTLRVTPPGPTVGCSIDQAFIPQECFYPGSKHQRSRVHLEAIYAD